MKKLLLLGIIVSLFALQHIEAQPNSPTIRPLRSLPRPMVPGQPTDTAELSRFNLDFTGGTPRQLADAIEKTMGKPLNVIIPPEYSETQIPPFRVNDVSVPQLFETLRQGSRRVGPDGNVDSSDGFTTFDNHLSDNTIWTFSVITNAVQNPLTKFSIDFPGGTPKELVAAIQRSTGKPLNVIVPEEYADTQLPPFKMSHVNVDELFHAILQASSKTEPYVTGGGMFGAQSYSQMQTSYGFRTDGKVTDESIWYFYANKLPQVFAPSPQKVVRFYALAPYLDHGLTVDDITTAVETGWKMAGDTSPPQMSFHKDTKLLIAVGDPEKLKTIDAVLQALKPDTSEQFQQSINALLQRSKPEPSKTPDATNHQDKKSGEDKPAE